MKFEIKFRYVFGYEDTIVTFYVTIKDIENSIVQRTLRPIDEDLKKFTLIARDLFTGLHDVNGKEIYEGDVIVIHNFTYEIVFVNGEFCGKALNISNPVSRCDAGNFQSCEIIGNIHETQECDKR